MTRNIMKVLHMVSMKSIMKVLYVAFCVFISAFFLGLLVYAGWGATPLSGSTMPVLAYIAVTALVLTGVIIALALAVVGMIVLYRHIFRLVIDGKNSPK
ncbi:hypothetical protein MUP59_01770 [Candidatus Bathyarchaeota archaeon]|nr:hypothetical protein [Candidatus Bathyarchaeota archaeon]